MPEIFAECYELLLLSKVLQFNEIISGKGRYLVQQLIIC